MDKHGLPRVVEKRAKDPKFQIRLLRMKTFRFSAVVAALLPLMTQSMAGNGMGSFGGHASHGSFGRGFPHQGRDHRFFYRHRPFFFGFDFVAFGFPYWWYGDYGYPYYGYPYFPYYDYSDDYAYNDSAPVYDERFWQDLATKVQSELARRGYYRGQINGVIDSDSRQAIRAFQKAQGLPVTGLIDPGVLRALNLPVSKIHSDSG